MLLLGLSTGHKAGLAVAVFIFVGFSLIVSMLVPRYRPQFPGRGLGVFLVACLLLFVGMMAAVVTFGKESEAATAEGHTTTQATTTTQTTTTTTTTQATTTQAAQAQKVAVSETEFKITFAQTPTSAGSYEFDVKNDGKIAHDFVVSGNGVNAKTPLLDPGKSATLKVDLKPGTYDVYCSVPGHKQAGMDVKLTLS
ncbi:MAG TPA: cupredoxin domain-containing protein [Gaiellaceae bacterium]|nr:cupredoxin domain-containing protein [Gaiellaceae bacterium]